MFYVVLTEAPHGPMPLEPEYYTEKEDALRAAAETEQGYPDYHVDVWLNVEDDGLSEMIDGTGELIYCSHEES
jgi:hypothetical protein